MTLHEQLRYIQHHWIPWLFYNEGSTFLSDLLIHKGYLFIDLLNAVNYDEPGYACPHQISDFHFSRINLRQSDGAIIRIIMPPPIRKADCREVFLVFSSDLKRRFYFTLELNADGGYNLCGWDVVHRHLQFLFKYRGHHDDKRLLIAIDRIFAETDIEKSISNLQNWH